MTNHDATRSLAIAYNAYNDAMRDANQSGVAVWGKALIRAQRATGVTLHPEHDIQRSIEINRYMRDNVDAA